MNFPTEQRPIKRAILYGTIILALFLVTILCFYPAIDSYFVLDDYNWIRPSSAREIASYFFKDWGHGIAVYRPLMRVSYYLDLVLFGLNPLGWHLHSFLIHAISVFFIFKILSFFSSFGFSSIASFLFLIMPLHHENICWISGRTHLLGGLFYFSSMFLFILFLNSRKIVWIGGSLALFALGLLSYETVVSLPFLLLFSLLVFRDRFPFKVKRIFEILIPYFGLLGIYLTLRMALFGSLGKTAFMNTTFLSVIKTIGAFLGAVLMMKTVIYTAAFILGILIGIYQKARIVLFSLGLIFLGYLPFYLVEGTPLRFLYLSGLGVVLGMGYLLYRMILAKVMILKTVGYVLLGLLIAHYVILDLGYAKEWQIGGKISYSIPKQLKTRHPTFPDGSTLIFYDIPLSYKNAGIFLTYFEEAIQRNYKEKLKIINVEHPFIKPRFNIEDYKNVKPLYQFDYDLSLNQLRELR
jgi:hypothetical protein